MRNNTHLPSNVPEMSIFTFLKFKAVLNWNTSLAFVAKDAMTIIILIQLQLVTNFVIEVGYYKNTHILGFRKCDKGYPIQ